MSDDQVPVRIMMGVPHLPNLTPEKIPCSHPTGHHWDQEGRCHSCGIPNPLTQPYMLCFTASNHGRATHWGYCQEMDAYIAVCETCVGDINKHNTRVAEIAKEQDVAQAAAARRRKRLN